MGNAKSKLKKDEVEEFIVCSKKRFTKDEIKMLYSYFQTISGIDNDDGVIDEKEFGIALGLDGYASSYFTKRIFHILDINGDEQINFFEFVSGLAMLSNKAPMEDKLYFSFRLYDVDADGKISQEELKMLLKVCLEAFPYPFKDEDIDKLVADTFKEADTNNDGFINFEEYQKLVVTHPMMLDMLCIDISSKISARKHIKANKQFFKQAERKAEQAGK